MQEYDQSGRNIKYYGVSARKLDDHSPHDHDAGFDNHNARFDDHDVHSHDHDAGLDDHDIRSHDYFFRVFNEHELLVDDHDLRQRDVLSDHGLAQRQRLFVLS